MASPLKRLWEGWKEIASYIGDFQSRLILTVFYFVVLTPFGLLTRCFVKPLNPRHSGWLPREVRAATLEAGRLQF